MEKKVALLELLNHEFGSLIDYSRTSRKDNVAATAAAATAATAITATTATAAAAMNTVRRL